MNLDLAQSHNFSVFYLAMSTPEFILHFKIKSIRSQLDKQDYQIGVSTINQENESTTRRCRSESELHLLAYERSRRFSECRQGAVSRRLGEFGFDRLPDDPMAEKAWEASRGGTHSSAGAS